MTFASRTQFHVERPWGRRLFSIVYSRGLLRDYKPSDGTNLVIRSPVTNLETLCPIFCAVAPQRVNGWIFAPVEWKEIRLHRLQSSLDNFHFHSPAQPSTNKRQRVKTVPVSPIFTNSPSLSTNVQTCSIKTVCFEVGSSLSQFVAIIMVCSVLWCLQC